MTRRSASTRSANRVLAALLALMCLGTLAVAAPQEPKQDRKEDRKLVMGSVYRIIRNLIEVKQEGSDLAVIKIDAATTYINSTSSTQVPAKLKDVSPGDQVVIKVVVKNGVDTAEQVRFIPAVGRAK
jgi:hypothetical protein